MRPSGGLKRGSFSLFHDRAPHRGGPLDSSVFTTLTKESVTNRARTDSYGGPGVWWVSDTTEAPWRPGGSQELSGPGRRWLPSGPWGNC